MKIFPQEPMSQFEPNLTGNNSRTWRFSFVQINGLTPFKEKKGEILTNLSKFSSHGPLLLMN